MSDDRYRQTFTFTIGNVADVEQDEHGAWSATIGDDVREEGTDRKSATNKAMAAYLRQAAANIEKTGKL